MTSEPVKKNAPSLRLIRTAGDGDSAAPSIDFQLIVEQSLNLVVFMDADGVIEYVNPRFCEVTGYSPAEVAGRRINELGELPPEQGAEIWTTVSRGEPWRGEFRARKKNGDAYWVYSCISPITSPAGVVTNYLAVNLDITERKVVEDALAERDSYFRSLLEDGADVIAVLDTLGSIRYVSPSVTRILGYDPVALLGERVFELIHPDDLEDAIASFAKSVAGGNGGSATYRDRVRHADGSWRTVESVTRPLADGSGIVVNLRDVTARVATEGALRDSETRFRSLVEDGSDVIAVLDNSGLIRYLSPSGERIFGFRAEVMSEKSAFEFIHPDDLPAVLESFEHTVRGPNREVAINYRIRDTGGAWRTVESMSRPLVDGTGIVVNLRDITDRVATEEALRESETRFRTVTESIYDIVSVVDSSGTIVYQSPSVERTLGYTVEERVGTNTFDWVHPDDQETARTAFAELMQTPGAVRDVRLRGRHKDGSWRPMESIAKVRVAADGSPEVIVTSRDVTERVKTEADLLESEERFRTLAETTTAAIFIFKGPTVSYANPAAEAITGYTSSELQGRNFWDIVHSDVQQIVDGLAMSTEPVQAKIRHKDGGIRWVEFTTGFVNLGGRRLVLGTAFDVTERVAAEDALRESETAKKTLLAAIPDMIFRLDADGTYLEFLPGSNEIAPITPPESLIGLKVTDLFPPDAAETGLAALRKTIETGLSETFEYELGSGVEAIIYEARVVPTGNGDVLAVVRDITERKRMEAALRESEERLRAIAETNRDIIWERDLEFRITYINPASELVLGYAPDDLVGRDLRTLMHPDDLEAYLPIIEERTRAAKGAPRDVARWRHADGSYRYLEITSVPALDDDDKLKGFRGAARDVTERMEAEIALRESEARLRTLLYGGPVVLFAWDQDGYFIASEGKGLAALGREAGQVVGQHITELYPEDSAIYRNYSRALSGEVVTDEVEVGGRWFNASSAPLWDVNGAVGGVIGVAIDITERRAAEEALRQSEERLRLALEGAQLMTWEWELSTNVGTHTGGSYVNLGEVKSPYAWDDFMRSVVSEDRERVTETVRRALEEDAGYEVEFRVEPREGHVRWIASRGAVVRDATGQPLRLAGVAMDITARKEAEEALRQSEERLRLALGHAQMTAWEWDVEEDAITNTATDGPLLSVTGRLTYDGFIERVHENDRERVAEAVKNSLESGDFATEFRIMWPDGSFHWVVASGILTGDANNPPQRLFGVAMDLTERKEAEEALRETDERLRYLLQNAPIVLSAWDKDGNYELFEGKGLEEVGIGAGSLVGTNLKDVLAGVTGDAMEGFRRALEGKVNLAEVKMADRWWTATSLPLRDKHGETVGVIGVSVDITERKEAERALRQSEERYRALYQDNPSMYFTVAEDGTVLSVNQFGAAQLGYTAEELIGNSVYEVFHKADRPAVRRQFAALAEDPVGVQTWEFRKVRKDGQIIWVKELVRAVRDAEGSATFLVVCEDISERKSMEAAMEVMREQVERRAERAVERGTQYGLSFRELTVLDLVAGGKSDKEIAVFLGIRPMTVSKHVANVLKKMSAASRAEAGVRAWREGLIR